MRSISSSVTVSAVRSYSFVVFGDAWPAICCACSSVPPVRQIRRDARRPERVAARRRRQTRGRRSPLDHRQHHATRQRPGRSGTATGRRSETTAPSRPRPRRRPDTLRRRPRPVDGPARRAACHPSRAAAATPESPAGNSPDAASPRPRSPARSCTPSRSKAPGHEDRPATPRRSPRAATASRPASAPASPPWSPRASVPHRRGRIHRQHLVDDQPVAQHRMAEVDPAMQSSA